MIRLFYVMFYSMVVLVGCSNIPETTQITPVAPVTIRNGDVSVVLDLPSGWVSRLDAEHLILMQNVTPMYLNGALNGVVVNIWLPQRTDLALGAESSLSEWLLAVVRQPAIAEKAVTTRPISFVWAEYEGAYYLLNSNDGNVTLVIALMPPQRQHMVAFNLSTSRQNIQQLLPAWGEIVQRLRVNGQTFDTSLVQALPQELTLPTFNPEAAMQSSPASP